MGYDLHVTRGEHRPIAESEWRAYAAGKPELEVFDFREGRVAVKNPDEATIATMLVVARALGARVEGDDGEIYTTPDGPPLPPRLSLGERFRAWLARLRPAPRIVPAVVPFAPGDRVRDFGGRLGTVTAVDGAANHGLGRIDVRFDDGAEVGFTAVAHGLEPVHAPR
jgi:hypothetical protein